MTKFDKKMISLTERLRFKIAIFSVAMMTVLGASLISPALPSISKHFHYVENIELLSGLVLTIPALSTALFSPLAGYLLDKFGKLVFLYPATILWILVGFSGYFVDNIYLLLLSRFVLGMATAFITTAASALLGDYYAVGAGRKDKALSLQGLFLAFGGAVMTMIGGFLASFSWNYVFIVYLSGFLIFFFCIFYLFEPRVNKNKKALRDEKQRQKVDYKPFVPTYFMGFFVIMMYYLISVQFPHYIEHNLGLDAKYIGFAMSASAISYGIFSFLYKDVVKILGIKKIYIYSLVLQSCSFFMVYVSDSFFVTILSLFIFGGAGGLVIVNNSAYLLGLAPSYAKARIYSILASCMFLGQFISPFITTPLTQSFGIKNEFLIWALTLLLVGLSYCFFKEKKA
ncbi:MFS transporter [Campylobacter avium]|uniref:MFS transporter n=1 Tax=Campylobacter avium TaxID=522485 RepID=UPI00255BEA0F|nr:MFS transporter [Campylobacter avium]